MLGLEYGTVRLAPYSEAWSAEFRGEKSCLQGVLAGVPCRIEHIGSTAVPGLPAKPILDIGIGVAGDIDLPGISDALKKLGYRYRGDAGSAGGHLFVRESSPGIRTHHLHLHRAADPQWEAYLRFRDLLREDPVAREAYAEEKQRLAVLHPGDREAYTAGKSRIVARLLGATP